MVHESTLWRIIFISGDPNLHTLKDWITNDWIDQGRRLGHFICLVTNFFQLIVIQESFLFQFSHKWHGILELGLDFTSLFLNLQKEASLFTGTYIQKQLAKYFITEKLTLKVPVAWAPSPRKCNDDPINMFTWTQRSFWRFLWWPLCKSQLNTFTCFLVHCRLHTDHFLSQTLSARMHGVVGVLGTFH